MITNNKAPSTDEYIGQQAQALLASWSIEKDRGLTNEMVKARLKQFGANEVNAIEESTWHSIFRRFWGPIPWMIEIAAVLSLLVQKWEDFAIVTIMLFVNAFLDFFQEHRAHNALKSLKQQITLEVSVLRDGAYIQISSSELVPGDIVLLRIGDIIPADVQLLDGEYLAIDESSLTGESLPVTKYANDVAYANTIINQGEMRAIVVNTANQTRFSSVVNLVAEASLEERSRFQKLVIRVGNFLIILTLVMVSLIVVVGWFRHEDFMELARFAMVLTIAAIPVALPAVLSVTMAVGAMNLARKKAIVTRLTAIEELAGVDIFCSDKTGTLTKNEMQVITPITLGKYTEQKLLLYAVLASKKENNDPIERPIFDYVEQNFPTCDWRQWQKHSFSPFDPTSKHTSARVSNGDVTCIVYKGAVQVLLEMAALTDSDADAITKHVDQLASKGYRTLAVAIQFDDKPFELVGLIPLIDPPREDSADVIQQMNLLGVEVKIITGDNIAIAREIGRMLGLEKNAVRSNQVTGKSSHEMADMMRALTHAIYQRLNPEVSRAEAECFANEVLDELVQIYDTSMLERQFVDTHESALVEMIESVDIFAEVLPEDKYAIIDILQKANHIVGMTGDGVNDAPALKKADCGFAVSNATDAARAAADIILTLPGLSVINDAIFQARNTFERMKSYATFRIAETIRIILFMSLSIVFFEFYPITALMVILLALLNDLPIIAIAYDNTQPSDKPVHWEMRELFTIASVLGVSGVVSSFLLFLLLRENGITPDVIQTLIFLKLLIAGHSTIFVTRNTNWFWKQPWPSPLLLGAILITQLIGTFIAVNGVWVTAISWQYALYIWVYALVWFFFNDMVKILVYKFLKNSSGALRFKSA